MWKIERFLRSQRVWVDSFKVWATVMWPYLALSDIDSNLTSGEFKDLGEFVVADSKRWFWEYLNDYDRIVCDRCLKCQSKDQCSGKHANLHL